MSPVEQYIHTDSQIQHEAIGLTHLCNNTFKLILSSFAIQSRFSIHNVFRHDLTQFLAINIPIRALNPEIPKYNAKRSEPHSSIKSIRIPKYNAKRSF
ncbi:uncharacterized protein G2W53_040192 [Senna tora]|uniref:Uncharacterized protein n=1 Tax=Senna tora TaxID=362788 RepID=A0A834SR73_9FABA|nr:uncharacterized protein G2W53_040192 [Senna tora]